MRTAFILHLYPEAERFLMRMQYTRAIYLKYYAASLRTQLERGEAQGDFKKSPTVHFNVDSQTGSDAASYIMMFIPLHAKQLH